VLANRLHAGARLRICLPDPDKHVPANSKAGEVSSGVGPDESRDALAEFAALRQLGAEIRLHQAALYNSIYRAETQLLVTQHLYGITDPCSICRPVKLETRLPPKAELSSVSGLSRTSQFCGRPASAPRGPEVKAFGRSARAGASWSAAQDCPAWQNTGGLR
jgi:hypothetical protein